MAKLPLETGEKNFINPIAVTLNPPQHYYFAHWTSPYEVGYVPRSWIGDIRKYLFDYKQFALLNLLHTCVPKYWHSGMQAYAT